MDLTTGYPYWLIKNGLPVNYPQLNTSLKTEVAIIGGGISGALTGYFLSKAGIDCVIVDGRTIGLGSTCASTSLLQYELDKPLSELAGQIGLPNAVKAYRLCSEALETLQEISEKLKFRQFEKRKSLYFAAFQKDKKLIESEFSFRKKAGFEVSLLKKEEIRKRFGFYAPSAILSEQGATMDVYMFTHALHKASKSKGLKIFDRTFVSKIDYQKNGVKITTDKNFIIRAKKVVNASGYELKEFIDKKIVSLHSTYALASAQIQQPNPIWKESVMIWNTANPYLYMRLTNDNRVIIGGRDEEFYSPGKRDALIKKKTAQLRNDFLKLFPGIELIPEFSWAGTFGSTVDSLPYIGAYHKTPQTYYALGYGGNGITFSIIAAGIIRDIFTGRKNSSASLFSFTR